MSHNCIYLKTSDLKQNVMYLPTILPNAKTPCIVPWCIVFLLGNWTIAFLAASNEQDKSGGTAADTQKLPRLWLDPQSSGQGSVKQFTEPPCDSKLVYFR